MDNFFTSFLLYLRRMEKNKGGRPRKPDDAPPMKARGWKMGDDVVSLLKKIAEKRGESQASILRGLIRDEAARLKVK